jgi:hypothetical protein
MDCQANEAPTSATVRQGALLGNEIPGGAFEHPPVHFGRVVPPVVRIPHLDHVGECENAVRVLALVDSHLWFVEMGGGGF